jgi:hypothetical protein
MNVVGVDAAGQRLRACRLDRRARDGGEDVDHLPIAVGSGGQLPTHPAQWRAYSSGFERRFRLIVNARSNDLERGRRRAVGGVLLSLRFGSVKRDGRPRSP